MPLRSMMRKLTLDGPPAHEVARSAKATIEKLRSRACAYKARRQSRSKAQVKGRRRSATPKV